MGQVDNLIRPEKMINERTSSFVTLTFLDETGAQTTPVSGAYTLYNLADGAVINSRSSVPITGSGPVRTIELTPSDNIISDNALFVEEHRLYVTYVYNVNKQGSVEVQILVSNMVKET